MSPTFADIQAAAQRIRERVPTTPCVRSVTLSAITGAEVFLKFENLQFTASFKERGALNKLLLLSPEERARGVIAMSAGNHAQGVAYHAKHLGIPAVIVMPRHTPDVKVEHTRGHGAEVILHGENLQEAAAFARATCRERDLVFVHPYDDPEVIAGQGTLALEMLAQQPSLDTLIVPIGGGGLLAGMAVAAHALKPELELIGVQSDRFPAMAARLRDEPMPCAPYTVAEGIAVKEPGELTTSILRELVREVVLVSEREIEDAILLLLQIEKTVVEGAGAAGLAALIRLKDRLRGRKVGLVLSGGNLDLFSLSSIIQRGLVRGGQIVSLRVETRDVPGALSEVSALIGRSGGNIIEVHHQRTFADQPLQSVAIDFLLRTRGPSHSEQIMEALRAGGCRVSPTAH
jgi:threonine dehydratase